MRALWELLIGLWELLTRLLWLADEDDPDYNEEGPMTQYLYIRKDGSLLAAIGSSTSLTFNKTSRKLSGKRGDKYVLKFAFLDEDDEIITGGITVSSTIKAAIKEKLKYDDDPLTSVSGTPTVDGSGYYELELNMNDPALNALFNIDGDSSNDTETVEAMFELEWTEDSGTTYESSETVYIDIENDVNRSGDTSTVAVGQRRVIYYLKDVYHNNGLGSNDLPDVDITGLSAGDIVMLNGSGFGVLAFYQLNAGNIGSDNFPTIGRVAADPTNFYWQMLGPDFAGGFAAYLRQGLICFDSASFRHDIKIEPDTGVYGSLSWDTTDLTDGATIDWDVHVNGQKTRLTIDGNRTLNAPTNAVSSDYHTRLECQITQGAGGSHTLSYDSAYKWEGGSAPALSTGAGQVDLLIIETFDGGATWLARLHKDFS